MAERFTAAPIESTERATVLVIRDAQMKVFDLAIREGFEVEMTAHAKAFSPRLCDVLGDDQVRVAIRAMMVRSEGHGFTNRGPMRLFIEMSFLRGSAFDTDPQYAAIAQILESDDDQMHRALRIHEWHAEYLDRVSGPNAVNVQSALREVLAFARQPMMIGPEGLTARLLSEMRRMFPAKAAFTGDAALVAIIDEAKAEALRFGFESLRATTLLAVLKFAFGHGCTSDALYPWISQTLIDDKIVGPAARATRLEKKAITWLEHVVARNSGQASS